MELEKKKTLPPLIVPPISSQPLVVQGHGAPVTKPLYKAKSSKAIGILQIIGGIMLFVFCVGTAVPQMDDRNQISPQIISNGFGALIGLILCGSFAICASKKKTSCLIITHMVFCVILTLTLAHIWFLSIASIATSADRLNQRYRFKRGADMDMPDKPLEHSDKSDGIDDLMGDKDDKMGDKKHHGMGDKKRGGMMDGDRKRWGEHNMGGDRKMGRNRDWDSDRWDDESYVSGCFEGWEKEDRAKISLGCACMVFILSLMQFIVSICGSALACKVTCCEKRGNPVSPQALYLPHNVELGGNPDVRSKAAMAKEQEANGMVGLDARELNPSSPPPAYS